MNAAPPLYRRIKDSVLAQIRNGELPPDSRVASESILGERFGASRLTVQRALRELVAEGLLRRVQGSGTFVNPPRPAFSLVEVRDIADEVRARGGRPATRVLAQERTPPAAETRDALGLDADEDVFHVAVLQTMDDVPVAHEERFARPDVYPDLLDQDFTRLSPFAYLASRSTIGEIDNVVRALLPDAAMAALLQVEAHEPCLHVERRNWWQGRAVTLTRITYAGSRQTLASRYRPYG
jgi:GntR family transcriptional regulator, histidine utilization repressor